MAQQSENVDFSSLFKLDVLIHLHISNYSFYEVGQKKFIALSSESELIFLYVNPQGKRTEKKFDWNFTDDPIKCMCFEPTGTWVLVVSDEKIFLIPFLPLFTSDDTFDYKWSLNEVTCIPVGIAIEATSVVWWLTKESENVLIIGTKSGSIIFYSLDSKSIVGECKVSTDVSDLQMCFDESLDLLTLLISGNNHQYWKLILEHRSLSYNWLQQCRTVQVDKDRKEGFMSYIKQLSKDKITLFTQGSSKDGNKTQGHIEYMIKPMEYLPVFRKGSISWSLSAQYVNGHHFLSAFDVNEGSLILEDTEEETPSRTLRLNIKRNGQYQQGLWSQRLIYLLRKNEVEVHSGTFSNAQADTLTGNKESTLLWSAGVMGNVMKAFLVSTRDPNTAATSWREPTFMCDLQLPRFSLEPCLIITNRGAFLLNTVCSACEWMVGVIMRGGVGAECAAAALGAPVGALLRASADMLLSRGKLPPAQYLYSLSQYPQDGWLARLGVFKRLEELASYKQPNNNMPNLGSSALMIKVQAQLLKNSIDAKTELDRKLTNLNSSELGELCYIASSLGLWDLVPTLSIHRGQPHLLLTAMKYRLNICRGAINLLLRQKNLIPLLEEDVQFMFDFLTSNCSEFDLKLLRRLCVWLCPLQDQLRPVFRDLQQGIMTIYTDRMLQLVNTFMHIASALEAKDPCPDISTDLPQHTETWKAQFVPRRSISCGLAHWAIADGGNAKILLTNTPIKTELIGRVISIACGRHHTIVLTENGIYSSGDNTYGQLGVGVSWTGAIGECAGSGGDLLYVHAVWSAPLVDVAAGHYHSAAIDVGGRLYTWGWGVHGQLGLGTIDDEWSPQVVTKLQGRKVLRVGCGSCHTATLMKNGEVWCWGAGVFGQLGGGGRHKHAVPVRVALTDPVCALTLGYFHNLALTVKGELWCWGASPQSVRAAHARRQVSPSEPDLTPGLSDTEPHLVPTLVDTRNVTGTIVQIAAGWHHSCLLNNSGQLYAWGLNFDGQLGSGDRKQITIPTEVKINSEIVTNDINAESPTSFKPFIMKSKLSDKEMGEATTKAMVACGGDFTVYIDDDGKIFITGNTHQQVNNDQGKTGNRVIMMKTTKRVIKIPANRANNKFLFQFVDRVDNLLNYDVGVIQRNPIDTQSNPLSTLSDLKRKSWADEVIMLLKPWIKEEAFQLNLNMTAKYAYHHQQYTDCLKYLLQNINIDKPTDVLYLKHTEATKADQKKDGQFGIKKEEIKVNIKNVIAKRIKEISMSILNDQPYPPMVMDVFKELPCVCNEMEYLPKGSPLIQSPDPDERSIINAGDIIDKCISMFPANPELWETCFSMSKDFYLENCLPVGELEAVLQKYMKQNAQVMASAIMFSKDCEQYSEILSPKFYLTMCTEVLNTWG